MEILVCLFNVQYKKKCDKLYINLLSKYFLITLR